MPHNNITLDWTDADTILRLKRATLYAEESYTGAVAVSTRRLYELHFDECCGVVKRALILAQYESRFGE